MAWWVAAATASIRTQDPAGCLDAEAVDLEVRDMLGDVAVDGLDLFLAVAPEGPARHVTIRVSDLRGELLYEKRLDADAQDCPLLASVVAGTVQLGLSDIPWRVSATAHTTSPDASLYLRLSAPLTLRTGFGGGVALPVRGPAWWTLHADGFVTTYAPVGTGVYQIGAAGVSTGPSVRIEAGRDAVDLGVWAWVGGVRVVGGAFDENFRALRPRLSIDPQVTFVSRAAIRAGVRGEIPVLKLSLVGPGQRDGAIEPPFRIGAVVGFGGSIRRSEGERSDGP